MENTPHIRDAGSRAGIIHSYPALKLPGDSRPRRVDVLLPRSWEGGGAYPLVLMNDGHTCFQAGLSGVSLGIRESLDALYEEEAIREVIFVAVHPIDRSYEYLHVPEFAPPRRHVGGGAEEYSRYLCRLKTFLCERYPALAAPESTMIAGSSHGGLAAFLTALYHPDQFGISVAMSPSFWAGGVFDIRTCALGKIVSQRLGQNHQPRPAFWIDWGLVRSGGFHNWWIEHYAARWSERMVDYLVQDFGYVAGRDLHSYADAHGGHAESAWARRFRMVLRRYYGVARLRSA